MNLPLAHPIQATRKCNSCLEAVLPFFFCSLWDRFSFTSAALGADPVLLRACFPAPGRTRPLTPKANDTFPAQPSSPFPHLGTSGEKTSLLPPSRTHCLLLNLPPVCRSRLLSLLLPGAVSGARLIYFSSILLTSLFGNPSFSPGIGRIWDLCPPQTQEPSTSTVPGFKASWLAGEEAEAGGLGEDPVS